MLQCILCLLQTLGYIDRHSVENICIYLIWTYIMLLLCILQGLLPRKEESPSPTEQHSTEVATPRHHRDSVFDLILRKSPIPQPKVPPQHRPIGITKSSKSSDGRRVSIFTVFAVSLEIHNCSTPRVSNWCSDNKYYQMCKHDTKALDCGSVIVVRGQPHPCPHPKFSMCCYRAIGSWSCVQNHQLFHQCVLDWAQRYGIVCARCTNNFIVFKQNGCSKSANYST